VYIKQDSITRQLLLCPLLNLFLVKFKLITLQNISATSISVNGLHICEKKKPIANNHLLMHTVRGKHM
jgi:hypothetical protein